MATKKKKPPKNKPAAHDAEAGVVEPESSEDNAQDAGSIGDLVAALGDGPPAEGNAEDKAGEGDQPSGDGSAAEPAEAEQSHANGGSRDPTVQLVSELPIDADDDLSEIEGEASPRLVSIVESLLFSASRPLTVKHIRKVLSDPTVRQVQLALKQLVSETASRGIVVSQVAGGFMLRTNPDNASYVQRLLQKRPVRLSRPQLETMAIIAYRQPTTRAEIDHVRGVDSGGTLKILLERDLIKIVGRREEVGRPMLYGTTVHFLEFFNLQSLRDLPDLREFRELSVETKERLKKDMNENEVEALGQEVIEFSKQAHTDREDPEGQAAEGEAAEGEGEGGAGEGEATQGERDEGAAGEAEAGETEPDEDEQGETEPRQSDPSETEPDEVEQGENEPSGDAPSGDAPGVEREDG